MERFRNMTEEQMFKALNSLVAKGYVKIVIINGTEHVQLTDAGKKWVEGPVKEKLN